MDTYSSSKPSILVVLFLVCSMLLIMGHAGSAGAANRPDVVATHGLVTSAHSLSSMAGTKMLMKGGNAIDAAVAVMSTLNVVEPNLSGAGGNGLMTVFWAPTGEVVALRMTGAAPYAVKPELFTPDTLSRGYQAGVVPGNFGGWIAALDKYGTMSLAEVLESAIDYAENGFPVSPDLSAGIENQKKIFEVFPTTAKVFLPGGKAPKADEILVQKDLANTFKKVVAAEQAALKQGKTRSEALKAANDRFYKGDIAQEFVRFYKEVDGLFTMKDFADYRPVWAEPVHTTYRGYDVYSSPVTSRGGVEMIMQLNLIEPYDLKKLGKDSAETLHLIAESIKVAKSDVYRYIGDPKFNPIPLEGMLSKEYAAERRKLIDPAKAIVYPEAGNPGRFQKKAYTYPVIKTAEIQPAAPGFVQDPECTTSFSIVDKFGNAVGCTPTLGGGWGTNVIVGNTGIFFNNGTRIGSSAPYPDNVNYVGAGKVPLLNNSPTIVLKDGKLFMVFGTPGGEGIGQTQFQVLLNVIDFGMRIQDAIEAPRFISEAKPDFFKPGSDITLRIEKRVRPEVIKALEAKGHKIRLENEFTSGVGGMQGILIHQGCCTGGADPRRGGYAIGW